MHVHDALDFMAGARAIFEDELTHSSAFLTSKVRTRDRSSRMISTYPRGRIEFAEQRWSFRSLFTFVNDLPGDWELVKSDWTKTDTLKRDMKLYYADARGSGKKRITVKIDAFWNISVKISRPDLVEWEDEWLPVTCVDETREGTRDRCNLRGTKREMIYWHLLTRNVRAGGNRWINHASFPFIDSEEFHALVLDLARRLVKAQLLRRPPTMFIFALHTSFGMNMRPRRRCLSESAFCDAVTGYFHLDLGPHLHGDSFEVVDRAGQSFSILRGIYVSPWARSILANNAIDGLMLDTTWRILRQYVTAILMAVVCNVGIPLGFAFGASETTELYEAHYNCFRDLFGIDLGTYVLESDQGAALTSLCARHGQCQLFCLRHFLLSLKLKEFSLPVGNLVKARSQEEFSVLKQLYEQEFRDIPDERRRDLLKRTLRKAGLALTEDESEIIISDEARFNAVSMWRRIGTRMPSTTNCLEATHGHLNAEISRRNPFWASLAILHDSISDKTLHFHSAFVHDFRTALKRSRRRSAGLDPERMREECEIFQSSSISCACSETKHLSACYRTELPCSHRYAMGATKPAIPEFVINTEPSTLRIERSETHHRRDPAIGEDREVRRQFSDFAYRQIRRFSHTKNKEGVRTYVDAHLNISGPSALDVPVAVHELIIRGIRHFTNSGSTE